MKPAKSDTLDRRIERMREEDERAWEQNWPQFLATAVVVENCGRFSILTGPDSGLGFGDFPTRGAAHSYLYRERKKLASQTLTTKPQPRQERATKCYLESDRSQSS